MILMPLPVVSQTGVDQLFPVSLLGTSECHSLESGLGAPFTCLVIVTCPCGTNNVIQLL